MVTRPQVQTPTQNRLNVREIWRASRRNPALALGVPLTLLASVAFFLWWTQPVYEASTTIRIDQERSGVAIIEALRTLSSGSNITTEMEELRSRTLAETVVDSLALSVTVAQPRKTPRSALFDHVATARGERAFRYTLERITDSGFRVRGDGVQARTISPGEVVAMPGLTFVLAPSALSHERIVLDVAPFSEAVQRFQQQLAIGRPNREADLVRVSYKDVDAPIVRAVPNLIAAVFIARRHGVRTSQARSTADFLTGQIATLHTQLTTTEDALRAFQERHAVLGIDAQSEEQVRRLAEMQAERELLEVERNVVATILAGIQDRTPQDPLAPSGYRALLGLPSILRNAAAGEVLAALNEAESARAKLLPDRTLDDPDVRALTYRIRQLEQTIASLAMTYLGGLTENVRGLDRTLAVYGAQLQQIPEQQLQLARLRRQASVTEELYTALLERQNEAEILAALDDPTVRVIDPAVLPPRPVSPNVPLSITLALFAGVLLGVGGAVTREQMDDTVRSRDELQLVGGVPVLGAIPRLAERPLYAQRLQAFALPFLRGRTATNGGEAAPGLMGADMLPNVAEAYRSLRTNITFARLDRMPRVILVTSPAPGDGKSTTACNLAITMTQQGHRCLLVDADMRRGQLHDMFGVAREPGLSNVLLGHVPLEDALHTNEGHEDRPGLLATGTVPPNPAELLGSDRMADLLAKALERYDLIVIDAPPLNLVTDAAVLARHAEGVLMVARAGVTQHGALEYSFAQLSAVSAPVLGSILNDADPRREHYYGSYMRGYYKPHA